MDASHTDRLADALVSADLAESRGDYDHLSAAQLAALHRGLQRLHAGDVTGAHAVSTILDRQVRMPAYRLAAAQDTFASLACKAEDRGLPVPTIAEVSRETIGEGELAEVWVTCRILGAAPVLDGWRCVATLTRVSSEELIRAALHNGTPVCAGQLLTLVCKLVAERSRDSETQWTVEHATSSTRLTVSTNELVTHNRALFAERVNIFVADGEVVSDEGLSMRCDHCEMNRRRNLVFVLRHEDGRELLVGSTCLNEYLGTDALGAWFVWSRLHETARTIGGWPELYDLDAHAEWLASHATAATRRDKMTHTIALVDFLAACVADAREHGFVRKTDSSKLNCTPTGVKVFAAFQDASHTQVTPADHARAIEILGWARTLDRYAYDFRGELTYTANLARFLDTDEVQHGAANMIASAVTAYDRELARRAEQAQIVDAHVGTVGAKIELAVKVTRRYGSWVTGLADGRTVCWQQRANAPEVGDQLRVKATVAEHGAYRGTAQTTLRGVKRV